MAVLAAPAQRKLPVWTTVGACYATVARNLGQLVRIGWLWFLIMLPVYAAQHWLDREELGAEGVLGAVIEAAALVAMLAAIVVESLFLASIAVAWHRLILRQERVTAPAYLRLDRTVWLYLIYSLLLTLLVLAPVAVSLGLVGLSDVVVRVAGDFVVALGLSLLGGSVVLLGSILVVVFVLPRLSLVLPAVALQQEPSLREAWRASRSNTLRLALATGLCMLPAVLLLALPSLFGLLLRLPWLLDFSWERIVGLMWVTTPIRLFLHWVLNSLGYAVFSSLASAVLAIFAVTLLSLAYRFFLAPREERAVPAA
jgi:hypothetical protein